MRITAILAVASFTSLPIGHLVAQERERGEPEHERKITRRELPPAVARAVVAPSKGGTKGGRVVAYEAHVTTNAKESEIKVGPDGNVIAEP